MSVSTDGIIAYGVMFEDGTSFPWDQDEFESDMESWWRHVNGFVDIHKPFDERGNYCAGWSRDDVRLSEHYRLRREWLESHPLPVGAENYCSGDYPS